MRKGIKKASILISFPQIGEKTFRFEYLFQDKREKKQSKQKNRKSQNKDTWIKHENRYGGVEDCIHGEDSKIIKKNG